MAKQGQKLLRVGAAAHELGLHPMTVRRWIKAGRIQVVQVGREVRVPRSEIERIVGSIDGRLVVLYGRVSGHGQKDDLETQLERLQAWAKTERKGQETLVLSRREIELCWRKYEHRNRALAHLASNVLVLLARVHGCSLLSMESLKTLKSTGRGKGVRGRWRNYRNNWQIRGEIWRLLRYKCHLMGLRFHTEQPRATSHTCPHCGLPAKTYRSPSDRKEAVKWGRWLFCDSCSYNGDRDYCASVNMARLGVAYLVQMKQTGKARSCPITDPRVKPVSYTGAGAALLLPPPSSHARPIVSGKICYYPGWLGSAFLQSSHKKLLFLRLCG